MEKENRQQLETITKQIRRWIVQMTTEAGSGHATSSLSSVELMAVLMFSEESFFQYDTDNPENPKNDRLIFSKGHASPLYYSLWVTAGAIKPEELMTFRQFDSRLEGHPTRRFPFTEVPTGSLGQGIGVGVGEALALRVQNTKHKMQNARSEDSSGECATSNTQRVFVLLGDSEIAEGSVWESAALASHYQLDNLVAVIDVNRLGQRGETMDGWDIPVIAQKFRAFGWEAVEVEDGHDVVAVKTAYETALSSEKPTVLVAKTIKGKGVSFLEDKNGWHGKALSQEDCTKALEDIGEILDFHSISPCRPTREEEVRSDQQDVRTSDFGFHTSSYAQQESIATRKVYGQSLLALAEEYPHLVALDAEVSNSTYSAEFGEKYPERFFEMFVAEQNMVSTAVGMARRGFMPFVSTFGAFFTRAMDQIRMAQYADVNVTFVGSHVGVSIGDDGASQMGLEDMAIFRALNESTVLYPSDAVSMMACVRLATEYEGITYIRTTRAETPILYEQEEVFTLGGSKTVRETENDAVVVVASGITVSEALKAYNVLKKDGVTIRVVDAYSIKPIDREMIKRSLKETKGIVVVEDHSPEGGLGGAVREVVCEEVSNGASMVPIHSLAVRKRPRSGTPEELLRYEEIDAQAIGETVKAML